MGNRADSANELFFKTIEILIRELVNSYGCKYEFVLRDGSSLSVKLCLAMVTADSDEIAFYAGTYKNFSSRDGCRCPICTLANNHHHENYEQMDKNYCSAFFRDPHLMSTMMESKLARSIGLRQIPNPFHKLQ